MKGEGEGVSDVSVRLDVLNVWVQTHLIVMFKSRGYHMTIT